MSLQEIKSFLAEKRIGIVGVSRSGGKLGNQIYQKLKESGYIVYSVHPKAEPVGDEKCVASIAELPSDVQTLIIIAGQAVTSAVLQDILKTNIRRVWISPSKVSPAEIQSLSDAGVNVISGYCPFMFLEPVGSVHSFHRFFARLLGKYPR